MMYHVKVSLMYVLPGTVVSNYRKIDLKSVNTTEKVRTNIASLTLTRKSEIHSVQD